MSDPMQYAVAALLVTVLLGLLCLAGLAAWARNISRTVGHNADIGDQTDADVAHLTGRLADAEDRISGLTAALYDIADALDPGPAPEPETGPITLPRPGPGPATTPASDALDTGHRALVSREIDGTVFRFNVTQEQP